MPPRSRFFVLSHAEARRRAAEAVQDAPEGHVVIVQPEKRSDAQNRRMWAMLADVSRQVDWYGRKLSADDWKNVFSASLGKLDVVPNLDSTGFVVLGLSTSRMSVRAMSDLIELMTAFGAEKRVRWTDPQLTSYETP